MFTREATHRGWFPVPIGELIGPRRQVGETAGVVVSREQYGPPERHVTPDALVALMALFFAQHGEC